MNLSIVSSYPPLACGLATFAHDLRASVTSQAPEAHVDVVAVTPEVAAAQEPEVAYLIRRGCASDYAAAAEYLNHTSADLICLQHEFGIFGGPEGGFVLDLLGRLRQPVVATLHTVLPAPPAPYRQALRHVVEHLDHVVVMSHTARRLLEETYGVASERISVIPHGVPDLPFTASDAFKEEVGAAGRTLLLTFGLLGPSKGIEFMLRGLVDVAAAHPEVLYLVLGATHPEIKRQHGERYRHELLRRVRELGLEQHVRFVDAYVELPTLCRYLQACDVYVTPYPGRDQISSGTLAYAVGAGRAVVSTPYLHAQELLADGRGCLVDYGDMEGLSRTLCTLVEDPERRQAIGRRAYDYGRAMTWPRVGAAYAALFEQVAEAARAAPPAAAPISVHPASLRVSLGYLSALTDDTGIFQHAQFGIPDRHHGYCTDDAARALVATLKYHRRHTSTQALALARTYLSFLLYAQRPDGHFHNFMHYDRHFIDEQGSEDTVGRALWGLGATVAWSPSVDLRVLARGMVERALHVPLHHPRACAYAICGLHVLLQRYPGAVAVHRRLDELAAHLARAYAAARTPDWHWFHDELTYANAKLPEALLLAHEVTGEASYKDIGLEALAFLAEHTLVEGQFDFIGNQGWFRRGQPRALFDQQPIEAGYMAEACVTAHRLTGDAHYARLAWTAVEWFYGRNRLGLCLYDAATGACGDGLSPYGLNLNRGAESIVAYLLGLLAVSELAAAHETSPASGRAPAPGVRPNREPLTTASSSPTRPSVAARRRS